MTVTKELKLGYQLVPSGQNNMGKGQLHPLISNERGKKSHHFFKERKTANAHSIDHFSREVGCNFNLDISLLFEVTVLLYH